MHFLLTVPPDIQAPITVEARLQYRKFDTIYMKHVYGKDFVNDLPIMTLAEDHITFPTTASPGPVNNSPSPIVEWQRWNDYGIGLLRKGGKTKGELAQAEAAFARVEALGRPDGPLNLARIYLNQGAVQDKAIDALKRAASFDPPAPPWSVSWFTGLVNTQNGHLDEAIANFKSIVEGDDAETRRREFDFSQDYRLLSELGQTIYERAKQERGDAGKTRRDALLQEAQTYFEQTLVLDPENATAHYNMSLIRRQLGDSEAGKTHLNLYRKYKPDDNARDRAVALARQKDPAANHAAEAVVIYDLGRMEAYEREGLKRKAAPFELKPPSIWRRASDKILEPRRVAGARAPADPTGEIDPLIHCVLRRSHLMSQDPKASDQGLPEEEPVSVEMSDDEDVWVPEDDTIIGTSFRWSLAVIAGLAVVVGLVLYLSRETKVVKPEQVIEAAAPEAVTRTADIPEVRFVDVTRQAGIDFTHVNGATGEKLLPETMGGGVAFFDYDRDGDPDLLLVNSNHWPHQTPNGPAPTMALYQNDGQGRFQNVTKQAGLDVSFYGMGVAVADYDGDGWTDLFFTAVGPNRLFHNRNGVFEDVTAAAGVAGADQEWSTSAGFFDYDNDGDLDLFVANYVRWSSEIDFKLDYRLTGVGRAYGPPQNYEGTFPYLYQNKGDGTLSTSLPPAACR